MDLRAVKTFLGDHLNTKVAVEDAAKVAGVSVATMYRYKAHPEGISLGVLVRLSERLGLPLTSGAAWGKSDIVASERRRLTLEKAISSSGGTRFTTLSPYTVNDEVPEITRALLQVDYGTRAKEIEGEVLSLRLERKKLYLSERYESWEIWNVDGYRQFFLGEGRFGGLSTELRHLQIQKFRDSADSEKRHRYFYRGSDLPMFGCYSDPGVALVRVEDIHLEFQETTLVRSFEETFNDLIARCVTRTRDEFVAYLSDPCP